MASPTKRTNSNITDSLPFSDVIASLNPSITDPTERTNPSMNDLLPLSTLTERTNPNIAESLLTLPFELQAEILSMLPVKLLLQLSCVCKSFNSMIFNPYFVRKHLNISTTHFACYKYLFNFNIKCYPLQSMFTDIITTNVIDLVFPFHNSPGDNLYSIACSCHGILCLPDHYQYTVVLCNPSIRKFKKLPPFQKPLFGTKIHANHGFGYDPVSDHYKVVVLYHCHSTSTGIHEDTTTVKVLTLGTHYWRRIPTIPFDAIFDYGAGKWVSATVNWLAYTKSYRIGQTFIVSFDLANESFQKIFLPDQGKRDGCECNITLLVWRDCLSIILDHDVWVMKTFGIQESWVKLFSVSYLQNRGMSSILTNASYICDGQLLLELWQIQKVIVYDSKNDTFKVTRFTRLPEVCVESLLTPDII
ncbi:F-box/kelch-repeat protein At3g23880-like [Vicia villosa]|uniref:F-box/kelch-repeat protein At3g23880-like n=1 Tax=Vicia villosa TaxID=3911 RepID=UPI00273C658F|nr:F-box/kelch-repeat protein At3g23880-like [Vicia villosa]